MFRPLKPEVSAQRAYLSYPTHLAVIYDPGVKRASKSASASNEIRQLRVKQASIQSVTYRGDTDLAIARANIDDAETFEEAAKFFTSREKFAVLNSKTLLGALMAFCASCHMQSDGTLLNPKPDVISYVDAYSWP